MKRELNGRLHGEISFTRERKQIVSLEINGDFTEDYDELNGKELDIIIKPHRERRSLDANGYMWVLVDKLSEKLRLPKTEIYRKAIKEIGGVSETVCVKEKAADKLCEMWQKNGIGWQTDTFKSKIDGCVNVILYYGSSEYDKAQMSALLDYIIQDCHAVDIPTETPDQIAEMLARWGE